MEVKKSPKANLEPRKLTWQLLGFVMVLAFLFVAFEWSRRDVKIDTSQAVRDIAFEEEIMPITEQLELPPPPPPAEVPTQVPEILNVVEDDEEVADVKIQSDEDLGQKVEIKTYVAPTIIEKGPQEDEIFMVVEDMPEPPGGIAELMKFLGKNIKYPTIAQENGIQGRVVVEFVVNRDGSIVDPKVVRGVDPSLDKEAVRVIMSMPKWKPGKQGGKTVRVKYTVPVTFRLK
ncbi:energy transducer TonB [Bacteroides propionicifaciens]|uniref:energy transducer TonB n=1 Tax=Bacteroides propionicifaciens TaxID=392838 RepID=UPI000381F347|nr:energy transducer TonB [Bacteroides propionicifaciens]